jgi:iron complex transport system permease protein
VLTITLVGVGILALALGTDLRQSDILAVLSGHGSPIAQLVVWQLRAPRFVLAALSGAMLGLSGVLLQDTLRNPLASPELLATSAGSTVVVAALVVFGSRISFVVYPGLALIGGVAASAVVLSALKRTVDPMRLILFGAALSALLDAVVVAVIAAGQNLTSMLVLTFTLGSFAGQVWSHVAIIAPWAVGGFLLAGICAAPLNLLKLGDDIAEGRGLSVRSIRAAILIVAAILVAPVVAVAGTVPWVALISPHMARLLMQSGDARDVLPVAALVGATLLSAADLISALLFAPEETPVGILLTLVAVPVVLLLIQRRGGAIA